MKNFLRSIALTTACTSLLHAGTVTGRVTDAGTGLALGGTRVTVVGTGLETYTSPDGGYVLPGVPDGSHVLEFSYVGYPEVTRQVAVRADGTRVDVVYGEAVEMERFVIEGTAVGTARAINQQRAASTLRNIIAADEIGRFPDQNAAEALQRVPGVSLYRDQGEGRYIVLRGLNYTFTSVKVNGGSFAGADLGDRATPLDVLPADSLAAIEVTKVPTPDMDADGLGGQIDLRTRSPFEAEGLAASVTAQAQYSELKDAFSHKLHGYISQRFGADGRYGVLIAPTWQVREFGSHNVETGGAWTPPDDNGTPFYVAEEIQFRDYEIERERTGLTASFEARPDETLSLYLRAGYTRFTDTESRHLTIFDFTEGTLDPSSVSAASATFRDLRRYGRRLRIREKDQEVVSLTAGGTKRLGDWSFDTQLAFTEGKERRPDEITARFRRNARDAAIRYDTRGTYGLTVEQLAGASLYDPSSYAFHRVDLANESGEETAFDVGLNARYDLPSRPGSYVKAGALFLAKEKESEGEVYELEAPASFTFPALAEPASDYPYLRVPRIRTRAVQDAFYGERAAFVGERVFEDSEFEDFSIDEDVLSAYVMGGVAFNRLNVLGGVRVERTDFDTTGRELDLEEETASWTTASRGYTNWLPGVYLRFDASKQLVFRASWSHSLARPDFGTIAYRSAINREDMEVTRGNPDLEALESTNWDASVEYYLASLGVLSASVFHKEIDNFTYEFEADDPLVIDGEEYELTTFANGSSGSITGLELAYQQQLRMLPPPFDGLGILVNVTFLDSEATYPTRPGEDVPFIGQSDRVGNVALTYEKARWFARLALNFRSERLREDEPVGGSFAEDLYVDDFAQLDLTVRYEIDRNWEVYAEFLNLTDEPFRVFLKSDNGQGDRLGQIEEYGWSANFGVRWKL